ncbi:NUDIX hydrolase [Anaerobacillus sp. MEB173]|uniref:NUDIX hydrolase n=1 Tax=Anaerobacillus sp. MEB173 TaxID=3383345 RepID=UPI003F8F1DF4
MNRNQHSVESIKLQLQNRTRGILGHEKLVNSAVLLPLVEINNEIHILFELRSTKLRSQPGEICFPGGKIESGDDNEKQTAIRETCEELGINPEQVEIIAELDYMRTSFDYVIYPFVGFIKQHEKNKLNRNEVEEIFYVPLSYLLETEPECFTIDLEVKPEEGFPYHLINNGKNYKWRTKKYTECFYFYEDYVIWGLTARILQHFLELIKTNKKI